MKDIFEQVHPIPHELGVPDDPLEAARIHLTPSGYPITPAVRKRLQISLVCKHWRRVMVSILYRTIRITNDSALDAVQNLMEHSPTLKRVVRRIDIGKLHALNEQLINTDNLVKLLVLFDRLEVLNIWSYSNLTDLCVLPVIPSLERLYTNQSLRFDFPVGGTFPRLKAARLYVDPTSLPAPNLQVLHFVNSMDPEWNLTNLHAIGLSISQWDEFGPFWRNHGHQLSTVFITQGSSPDWDDLGNSFDQLSNVKQFIVQYIPPATVLNRLSGLKVLHVHMSPYRSILGTDWPQLIENIKPNLDLVRFSNIPVTVYNDRCSEMEQFVSLNQSAMETRGIRLDIICQDGSVYNSLKGFGSMWGSPSPLGFED